MSTNPYEPAGITPSLLGLDTVQVAFEFLRRNKRYQADYDRVMAASTQPAEAAAIARAWGMGLHGGPETPRRCTNGLLAA